MANSEGHAVWFKMFAHQNAIIQAAPAEAVGKALQAAMNYFVEGTVPQMEPLATVLFLSMQPSVDKANEEYETKCKNGKKGGRPKKETKPDLSSGSCEEAENTEVKEAKEVKEAIEVTEVKEEKEVREDKDTSVSASPVRFAPPSYEAVKEYCIKQGYRTDPEGFVDYYTANGWKMGNVPMQDWKAALRNWNRKEKHNGKTEPKPKPTWTVGTVL